jgi:hypothetical protein
MVAALAGADAKIKIAARIDSKPGTPDRAVHDFMLAPVSIDSGSLQGRHALSQSIRPADLQQSAFAKIIPERLSIRRPAIRRLP